MKIIQFLGKFSLCYIILIIFEGILTVGKAFEFDNYTPIAWSFQIALLLVCVWAASSDWGENHT